MKYFHIEILDDILADLKPIFEDINADSIHRTISLRFNLEGCPDGFFILDLKDSEWIYWRVEDWVTKLNNQHELWVLFKMGDELDDLDDLDDYEEDV